jgi:hygromycin-B 7''-O-kinase
LPAFEGITTVEAYWGRFKDLGFGRDEACEVALRHGLQGAVERRVEGSNLVFTADRRWIKIYPPFAWSESCAIEIAALAQWQGRLPVATPRLIATGTIHGWVYAVVSHLEGASYATMRERLDAADRLALAAAVGRLIGAIAGLPSLPVVKALRPWQAHLDDSLRRAREIHRERGCSELWAGRIADFLQRAAPLVRQLDRIGTVHADINHAHLYFDEATRRPIGLIDFADATEAPIEMELVLPLLDYFRGDATLQRVVCEHAGIARTNDFSTMMMAVTLLNRFLNFENWFRGELKREGVASVDDVARLAFPS